MSVMSQPIPDVKNLSPMPQPRPRVADRISAGFRFLRTPLKMLAGLLIAPVFVVIALLSFLLVLADFAVFRLQDLRDGHPHPKGLWEF